MLYRTEQDPLITAPSHIELGGHPKGVYAASIKLQCGPDCGIARLEIKGWDFDTIHLFDAYHPDAGPLPAIEVDLYNVNRFLWQADFGFALHRSSDLSLSVTSSGKSTFSSGCAVRYGAVRLFRIFDPKNLPKALAEAIEVKERF